MCTPEKETVHVIDIQGKPDQKLRDRGISEAGGICVPTHGVGEECPS
jgi:hypothetical protein